MCTPPIAPSRAFTTSAETSEKIFPIYAGEAREDTIVFILLIPFFTGASQFLVGLGSVISCSSEAVMFFGIFYIFRHFSHATLMAVGLVGYIFRFCVFASVTNPWLVLPVEIFQGGYIYTYFSSFFLFCEETFNSVNQYLFSTTLVRN